MLDITVRFPSAHRTTNGVACRFDFAREMNLLVSVVLADSSQAWTPLLLHKEMM